MTIRAQRCAILADPLFVEISFGKRFSIKEEAILVAEPAGPDLNADVTELVALPQALADLGKRSQSGNH
jgi:hypothetical protein